MDNLTMFLVIIGFIFVIDLYCYFITDDKFRRSHWYYKLMGGGILAYILSKRVE